VSFDEFVPFDDNVAIAGTFSVEEILQSYTTVNRHDSDHDDDEKKAKDLFVPSQIKPNPSRQDCVNFSSSQK